MTEEGRTFSETSAEIRAKTFRYQSGTVTTHDIYDVAIQEPRKCLNAPVQIPRSKRRAVCQTDSDPTSESVIDVRSAIGKGEPRGSKQGTLYNHSSREKSTTSISESD